MECRHATSHGDGLHSCSLDRIPESLRGVGTRIKVEAPFSSEICLLNTDVMICSADSLATSESLLQLCPLSE
jgi:hypothetical protein